MSDPETNAEIFGSRFVTAVGLGVRPIFAASVRVPLDRSKDRWVTFAFTIAGSGFIGLLVDSLCEIRCI